MSPTSSHLEMKILILFQVSCHIEKSNKTHFSADIQASKMCKIKCTVQQRYICQIGKILTEIETLKCYK